MENGVGFKSVGVVFKKYWWVIFVTIIIGGAVGIMTAKSTISYETTAKVYVNKGYVEDKKGNGIFDNDVERFWQSINSLSKTQSFKKAMTKEVRDYSSDNLLIDSSNGSKVIAVKYTGATQAKSIKGAKYATELLKKEVIKYDDEKSKLVVIDQASKDTTATIGFSNKKTNSIMGIIYGAVLGFILSAIHFIVMRRKN
ncbi:hypothetical protein LOX60_08855 [Latilactobacillus curvatus]|uniref:hypothetical protein n=1 Tax=Latilactobacillus curvatus TaxID=28038 RepID=UPI000574E0C8|nr:hypothetical protein [Latilactobacillus curvatus]ANY13246.1 hypothetical protein BCY75_04260 [Latilactobacillus curvatus]AOO74929.1 hypothetical protein LCW_02020 [Latilactobacillus curvatus]KHO13167.1 MPA1 family cytoplasmic membrane-periplasmic auxiliary transporter [Latilactobacillus curvatus]MCM0725801.1 hypothetical protein [Latilactobacillus curvatus]MCP8848834.1 hypothetical protein [Latilactobacillus curvatus]